MTAHQTSPSPISGSLTGVVIPQRRSSDSVEAVIRRFVASWNPIGMMNITNLLTSNERDLAASLCAYLNQMTRAEGAPFTFYPELPQPGGRSLDMAAIAASPEGILVDGHAYSGLEYFHAVEAKVVPQSGNRQREYIVSDYRDIALSTKSQLGGIERFKQGIYAPRLTRSSMVAFVQGIPNTPWLAVFNGWIDDLIPAKPAVHSEPWCTDDHLQSVSSGDRVDEFSSEHTRPNRPPIRIRHFLIYLAGKN